MVASLLHPLNIFIVGLGAGFLIPVFDRLGKSWVTAVFILALATMTLISGYAVLTLLQGAAPIEILTGGAQPPYAINLRMGLSESIFAFCVNLVALFGATYVARERYGVLLLFLLLVMGIQGMVMTRDLFNLFVFLEIVSIATYGLLGLRDTPAAFAATFKFLMATVLASTFFLIGTVLLYAATGILNIDDLIANRDAISGPIGFAALMFLLACLLLELKPFPANGWGLDAYETARSDIAAMISGGVSAGVFYALFKLLPLFDDQLEVIAVLGAVTFVFSNLIGLRQTKAQRLLGYSSVGQIALLTIAASLLYRLNAEDDLFLVVGGLFVNHLFAKVGLFWLAGYVGKERLKDWSILAGKSGVILLFGILIVAISGLPPFPGFWAKWQLVMTLAANGLYGWIAVVLVGSLLEAAYMFRWLGLGLQSSAEADKAVRRPNELLPLIGMAVLLAVSGYIAAELAGLSAPWVYLPLVAGLAVYLLAWLPSRVQGLTTLVLVLAAGSWLVLGLSGLSFLFAVVLLAGGLIVSIACLARTDRRPGFYPCLAIMLLSLPALATATTSLEFIFIWELITLSSYFLILRRSEAAPHALKYLLFSLAAASFLLCAFAVLQAQTGSVSLTALRGAGPESVPVFVLLAIGLLIKAGAVGVHVWLPDAYAQADDDVSALLSAVISKVTIFGLLVGTYVAIRSEVSLNLALVLGWIGMLTTLAGAMLAVRQDDMKRMLAYSSMSQLGYIIAAIALMSHLGWVTALYLVANHLLVKGILFLVAAGVIVRTGARQLADLGGLARSMPLTFVSATIAIVAMSGLPPLAGFGGKWLLLSAMMEKGWYGPALMTLLATFVGFLYMARFIQAIFFDSDKARPHRASEAPLLLLIPQYLLVAGILVMSFFPKLLIEPVSQAIDPQFASTLVWQGMSLEMIYGYWNPVPVMAFAVIISAILFGVFWSIRRAGLLLSSATPVGLHQFFMRVFAALTPPFATAFWGGLTAATTSLAQRSRRLYTGNGQTYSLYILYYFIVLYIAGGGVR
ncbi:MAG TPA: proton-conducting transporter membrane subunit [Pseudolabrys sp.]|nr:proton-conducting transporter membrane subunit [Pseudolabrys sp.]